MFKYVCISVLLLYINTAYQNNLSYRMRINQMYTCYFKVSVTVAKTYTIHTPAAMFKGFTVTQFHTPETAQAA